MADEKRPQAVWEPGTLDATRKNIGTIDPEEAARMTKILGGEIMTEKSAPIDYAKLPKRAIGSRVVGASSQNRSQKKNGVKATARPDERSAPSKNFSASGEVALPPHSQQSLPVISAKDNQQIDRLMMSAAYAIKPNYGLFNFVKHFSKNGSERVLPGFAEITLKSHLNHLESFLTAIKNLIQISPDTYKSKIQIDTDLKFRFLRKVASWSIRDAKLSYINLSSIKGIPVVADLVPFTRAMYKQIITAFYLNEGTVPKLIKDTYTDILHYQNIDKIKLASIAKTASNEWNYIRDRIIRGLYPLLMRMCGTPFAEFPQFFKMYISQILNFLGLKKFDLLIAEKKPDAAEVRSAKEGEDKSDVEAEIKKKEQASKEEMFHAEMRERGITLLNRLFPGALWNKIDEFPDMWPYFNPLYDFDDCFLLLAPENPLQITIILCEILQDFFHACTKMKFNLQANPILSGKNDESIIKALSEWPVYVDTMFEKEFGELLKTLANQVYSQANYTNTRTGKKTVTDILWLTKYSFLPFFSFEQLLLERPLNNTKYLPLFVRVSFLKNVFEDLAKQISHVENSRGIVSGLENPWEHYEFEFESPISKRLDVLLNAKEHGEKMSATNANVIKYISYVISVLDWWINTKTSPAYKADSQKLYRTMPGSNEPAFSVDARDDQDRLFVASIRAAFQKKSN